MSKHWDQDKYSADNPYFDTDFDAYDLKLKSFSENTYNNMQAWNDRLWADYMLDKTNDYNSIGSQLERARDAGVSPSALLEGKYNSATANPLSVPGARSSGADMRNLNDSVNNVLNSTSDFVTQIRENRIVDSNIRVNEKQLIKIASEAGVNNANAESIRLATSWANMKNYSEIRKILAEEVKLYNDVYNNTRGKDQDIKESESNIDVNEAEKANIEADTKNKGAEYDNIVADTKNKGAEYENIKADTDVKENTALNLAIESKYADRTYSAQMSQEELKALELYDRRALADLLGVPLGTQEFEFNYALHKSGKLPDYYNNVLVPYYQSSWKPNDYKSDYVRQYGPIKISKPYYFFGGFNPMRGIVNYSSYVGRAKYQAKGNYYGY